MYLEHLWKNVGDRDEVLFLFKIDNIENAKSLIQKLRAATLSNNPNANVAKMTYLE